MAGVRQTTEMITGRAGSGKSYLAVEMIINQFIPYEVGQLVTNLPLNVEEIVKYCGKKFQRVHKLKTLAEAQEIIRKRIEIIPREVCQQWAREDSHLAEYFGESDIAGALVIIDEIHNFAGKRHSVETIARWQEFCGELRHRKASVMLLTQEEHKLSVDILREGGLLTILSTADEEVVMGVRLGDWLDLMAKFTGKRTGGFLRKSKRQEGGRWVEQKAVMTWFRADVFRCYDSFTKPVSHTLEVSGESGAVSKELREQEIWERLSILAMLGHFWGRNWFPVTKWVSFFVLTMFFTLGPGAPMVLQAYQSFWRQLSAKQQAAFVAKTHTTKNIEAAKDPAGREGQNEYLIDLANNLQNELAASAARAAQAESKLAWMSAIAIVSPKAVTFRNGMTYGIGETVDDGGPYNGQKVVRIDHGRRIAQLNSGIVLRLSAAKPCACNAPDAVPGSVSSGGKVATTPTPAARPGAKVDDLGRGSSVEPVRTIPEPANKRVDRGSGEPGFQAVQPIRKRSTVVGSPGSGGASPRGAGLQSGRSVFLGGPEARGSGGVVPARKSADVSRGVERD